MHATTAKPQGALPKRGREDAEPNGRVQDSRMLPSGAGAAVVIVSPSQSGINREGSGALLPTPESLLLIRARQRGTLAAVSHTLITPPSPDGAQMGPD